MARLELEASCDELERVMTFTEEQLEAMDCPLRVSMQLQVAVEELFVNVASYAYPEGKGRCEIVLTPVEEPRGVTIAFTDSGIPYDPTARQDPDTHLAAEDRPVGGLGIYMVRKSMDTFTYRREDGRNIVTIGKRF